MRDVLKYKEFIGSVHFGAADKVFYGKIEGINDLVTFEGDTVEKLEKAFHEAADDYIVLCREAKKKPRKSYMGSFNVRIPSSVHSKAAENAFSRGVSLNQFVQTAIERELNLIETASSGGKEVSKRTQIKTKA